MFRGILSTGVALGVVLWCLVIVSVFLGDGAASASRTAAPPPRRDLPPLPSPVVVDDRDLDALRARRLQFPVSGFDVRKLHDSFEDPRGGGTRLHGALDVAAPRGTPVLAVDDGAVARLHNSVGKGGLSVYHFDSSNTYCYYYAHLDRYAAGLKDGITLKKGDVVGYVGTTGNAPPQAPHLHFAVFKLGPDKRWGHGVPVNAFGLWAPKRAG